MDGWVEGWIEIDYIDLKITETHISPKFCSNMKLIIPGSLSYKF